MKKNLLIILLIIGLFVSLAFVSAVDFTPQGDINLRDTYVIKNAPNISSDYYCNDTSCYTVTEFLASGSVYSAGSNLTLTGQVFSLNTTGVLEWLDNIYLKITDAFDGAWASLTGKPTVLSNFTDDLGDRGYDSLSNFTDDLGARGYNSLTNFSNDLGIGNWSEDESDYYNSTETDTQIESANTSMKTYVDDENLWEVGLNGTQLKTADEINLLSYTLYFDAVKKVGLIAVAGDLGVGLEPGKVLRMNTNKITGVVDPTADQDAATKKYVDDVNATMKTYVDEQDTSANTSVVNWVDLYFPRISELVGLLGNYSAENTTIARIGDCPAGQFVQNSTTGGVECAAAAGSGDITNVIAGTGLLGGGDTGDVTLNVSADTCGAGNVSKYNGTHFLCIVDSSSAATDTNASTACATSEVLVGNGTCVDSDDFYDNTDTITTDTNASTACSTTEVLLGNGTCLDSDDFFDDTTIADTNASTACSTSEVLVGNGSCVDSDDFYDDTTISDTNASTACSTTEVLLGNGTCIDSDDFYDNVDTTYTNGSGISLEGTQFNHSDTSSQASDENSGNTFIQDIVLDTFGHITSIVNSAVDFASYVAIADLVGLVGNWSLDKSDYSTTAEANSLYSNDTNTNDGNASSICATTEVLLGNGTCFDSDNFYDDTTISDTNASTACATSEVLVGNGSCVDSDDFYDNVDTTYTAGDNLDLTGTVFSLEPDVNITTLNVSTHFVIDTVNITCLNGVACTWYSNATDSCLYWPSGGKDCGAA